jgi:4-amino-4-deoxy-L-arabinose transferase-like glycosyltransferase
MRTSLVILAVYLSVALLVDPRGEFPLNDDWCYTRSAFRLGTGAGMHLDEWAAPSLVGQALYGALLVSIGGTSFTMLRVSTLALSCAIAAMLWFLLTRLGVRRELAWVATLAWIFNPVQFCLSFTFMTEVPFLFFVVLGSLLYSRHIVSRSRMALCAAAASFGYAFLIRQTAALFIGPALCASLLGVHGENVKRRLLHTSIIAGITGAIAGSYYLWLGQRGGLTPATQRKFDLLEHLTPEQILGNSLGILFYLSFMLLPVLTGCLPDLRRFGAQFGRRARIAWLAPWALAAVFGVAWFYLKYSAPEYLPSRAFHSRMPLLLNILYDSGLGPVTLDPTYYGVPATPVYPNAWRLVTLLTAASIVPLGAVICVALGRLRRMRTEEPARMQFLVFGLLSVFAVAAFEIIFSHLQEGGLFDRHLLTAAVPATFLFAGLGGRIATPPGWRDPVKRQIPRIAAVLSLTAMAWFSVAATHDYLAWNRIRWELGSSLLADGVDPLAASCGFEFNAWHNYDTFRARGNVGKVYYWWYDSRDYLIAMSPVENYGVLLKKSFHSWLHKRDVPLYLLRIRNRGRPTR